MKRPNDAPAARKASLMGTLFNPRLGASIAPLRQTTQVFVHLIAAVFSLYGLFPKNHPALLDQNIRLSFAEVFGQGWKNVAFTREGARKTSIFFIVIAIILVSGLMAVSALLSVFIGHAHAQTLDGSVFSPPATATNDLAQSWINFLFSNPSGSCGGTGLLGSGSDTYTDTYSGSSVEMDDPFAGGLSLQCGLLAMLGMYSNAILIVAAFILFYHLTAMVAETAHHGVPMGKRASQIWAPIRLVVAIGLLVPISSSNLNCGQLIVIQMAKWGSGLASSVWSQFLTTMASYNPKPVAPGSDMVLQATVDIIRMKACEIAWNTHVNDASNAPGGSTISLSDAIMQDPTGVQTTMGNVAGTKYSYSSNTLADKDICGWYFIPSGASNTNDSLTNNVMQATAQAQQNAINDGGVQQAMNTAACDILPLIDLTNSGQQQGQIGGTNCPAVPQANNGVQPTVNFNNNVNAAAGAYQVALNSQMASVATASGASTAITDALTNMQKYGWVMAGSYLNTISRIQGVFSSNAADGMIKTQPPELTAQSEDPQEGILSWGFRKIFGGKSSEAWNIRKLTANDMNNFDIFVSKSLTNYSQNDGGGQAPSDPSSQCSAMLGLGASQAGGWATAIGSSVTNAIFYVIDYIATLNGVWKAGDNTTTCGGVAGAPQTFSLGVQISNGGNGNSSHDPFSQMAFLGHANLNVAMFLATGSMLGKAGGGIVSIAGGFIGSIFGGLLSGAGSILSFFAFIFFVCGFTLAYLLPLMPFMHFFFSVLSWVAAIIEGVIAVPLVALAHLNPEGEGLPGQARNAYFFIFNLFLRPVLTVFGLICGLIVFLIALSFLNYAYGIAVAGAGGTAYGHAAMSRIVYSVLYVAILYICANHAFQLIDHIPQNAMGWMGASGQPMAKMGDVGKMEQIGALVSSYGGQKMIGSMGAIGEQAGGAIAKGAKDKDDDKSKAKAADNHRALAGFQERTAIATETLARRGGGSIMSDGAESVAGGAGDDDAPGGGMRHSAGLGNTDPMARAPQQFAMLQSANPSSPQGAASNVGGNAKQGEEQADLKATQEMASTALDGVKSNTAEINALKGSLGGGGKIV